jgi:hypothetical protein
LLYFVTGAEFASLSLVSEIVKHQAIPR